MALVTCHECRRRVSSYAKTCPHCGAVRNPDLTPAEQEEVRQAISELTNHFDEMGRKRYGDAQWAVQRRELVRKAAQHTEKTRQAASKQLLIIASVIVGLMLLMWLMMQ